jgi:hypothetical protein
MNAEYIVILSHLPVRMSLVCMSQAVDMLSSALQSGDLDFLGVQFGLDGGVIRSNGGRVAGLLAAILAKYAHKN